MSIEQSESMSIDESEYRQAAGEPYRAWTVQAQQFQDDTLHMTGVHFIVTRHADESNFSNYKGKGKITACRVQEKFIRLFVLLSDDQPGMLRTVTVGTKHYFDVTPASFVRARSNKDKLTMYGTALVKWMGANGGLPLRNSPKLVFYLLRLSKFHNVLHGIYVPSMSSCSS
jgi:hypothetical protein